MCIRDSGYDPDQLTILLLQMVALFRDGELVKLSKRSGDSVTLDELIDEVGVDASRYFFLMRSLDSQLDFDINLAKSRSKMCIRDSNMLEHFGMKPNQAVVFGDGYNDLSMFRPEWLNIAMGNARPELKAKADYITTDCDKDGIYNACKHFKWID